MKRYKTPKDIKVGVIGYGAAFNMGRHHLYEMGLAGMTPTAMADIDETRLPAAEADYPGIKTYRSVTEMLKKSDVDLLAVITPHNTHAKLAIQCLNAGRHVVTEKPFAIGTAECDAMIAAAKKNKVMLSTYHNRHWDGCILQGMKLIKKEGLIGDILRVNVRWGNYEKPGDWWRTSKTISGGIMYDWGVHLLEYSLQLIDADIAEVQGFSQWGFWAPKTKWKKDTNEDEGTAVVRFANGRSLSLTITNLDANKLPYWMEVTGTKGTYLMNHETYEVILPKGNERIVRKGPNPPGESPKFYQNIADHLTRGEKLIITPEWARRPIHILDLAGRSAKKGACLPAQYK